jgi:hypothetical protein
MNNSRARFPGNRERKQRPQSRIEGSRPKVEGRESPGRQAGLRMKMEKAKEMDLHICGALTLMRTRWCLWKSHFFRRPIRQSEICQCAKSEFGNLGERPGDTESGPARTKHVQLTKICSSSKLTFVFSEVKVSVSFPMPSRPYPQLLFIKRNNYLFFPSKADC